MKSSSTKGRKVTKNQKQQHVILGFVDNENKGQGRFIKGIALLCSVVSVGFLGVFLLRVSHGATIPKGSSQFTAASWNVQKSNSASKVVKGTKALTKYVSIIGFQELHGAHSGGARQAVYDNFVNCSTSACPYDSNLIMSLQADGSHAAGTGIIWKKSIFTALDKGYEKISEGETTSTKYKISSKWLSWVKLREAKTGRIFYAFNTHVVAGGVTRNAVKDSKEVDRYNNTVNHITFLVNKITALRQSEDATIIMMGDFNVNYRKDVKNKDTNLPHKRFTDLSVVSNWDTLGIKNVSKQKGTHKGSDTIIDYVWITDNRSVLIPIATRIANNTYGSDHYPVILRLALTPQAKTASTTSGNGEAKLPSGNVIESGTTTDPALIPDPDAEM